ncbi:MAG: hypothetical protein ACQ9ET_00510 [Nitrosomonadaceae bacterium]
MKGYVGTLMNLPESIKMADRCIESGKQFGVDIEIVPAVWRDVAMEELKREGLVKGKYDESWSNNDSVIGNFITQYRTWNLIVESNEPGIVLEHDAVFVNTVPDLTGDIVNIGKPSYGQFRIQPRPGIYPMFSKVGGYIPGAHGYYLTPKGAQLLITKAKANGAAPCDIYLNKTTFPDIQELYPWVVEARDEFTTIQVRKGCIAKHNFDDNYEIK